MFVDIEFVDIDSTEEVVSLFEMQLQKTKNLSAHESEECEHGEVVGVETHVDDFIRCIRRSGQ